MAESKTIDPGLVAEIVGRYVAHNHITAGELPDLIAIIHRSLAGLGQPEEASVSLTPAVAINRSYGRDFVICLDCGWRGLILRRHLTVSHGLSPRDYRARWNLRDTHPLIAPAYSERRSTLAKQIGLGQGRQASAAAPEPQAPPPKRRGRPRRTAPSPATP
jgi:predicted transcriptional regulator